MKRVSPHHFLTIFLVFLATAALPGCGKPSSGSSEFDSEGMISSSCGVATDQRKTFMAKVPGFPLQLSVDTTFTQDQRTAFTAAVDQWNQLGRKLMGQDFYRLRFVAVTDRLRAVNPTQCTANFGTPGGLSILNEASGGHWQSLGFGENIPAATLRCFSGSEVTQQMVMVYTGINQGRGIDPQQFSSVVLHELGHVLGLDHSCDDKTGSEKFAACSNLVESHPYHAAVMYPSLRVSAFSNDATEIKDRLKPNDELRTSCLYRTAP